MKRRKAIRNIILVSSGFALLPSCDFETFKVYENLPLEKEQYKLIRLLQNTILPKKEIQIKSPETVLDFSLSFLNDCYKMEDIQEYLAGLADFQLFLTEKKEKPFKKLEPSKQLEVITAAAEGDDSSDALKFFMETNKGLAVRYFTQSEYFLTTHLEFEFVPGRYIGCATV
jgi:hypothetical protein